MQLRIYSRFFMIRPSVSQMPHRKVHNFEPDFHDYVINNLK